MRDDDALLAHRLELLEAEAHRVSERCIEIEQSARPAQDHQVREPATQPDDSAADALRHIERRMHALEETLARVHDELNAARVPRERSEEPRDLAELRVLAASLQQQLVDRQLTPHVRLESLELLLALPAEARGVAIDLATHALEFAIE